MEEMAINQVENPNSMPISLRQSLDFDRNRVYSKKQLVNDNRFNSLMNGRNQGGNFQRVNEEIEAQRQNLNQNSAMG